MFRSVSYSTPLSHRVVQSFKTPLPLLTWAGKQRTVSSKAQSTVGGTLPVIIETKGVPVYLYAKLEEVEKEAVNQLIKIAESPLPVGYVAAMPDVHLGKGVTIGSVFASDRYVCPNAVGVDIGCGMCAVPMNGLYGTDMNLEQLTKIQQAVKRRIPTGFNEHKTPLQGTNVALDEISHKHPPTNWLLGEMSRGKAAKQLGTLGGGNHFLEVVCDETNRVWILLHSGSRNIGNTTAQYYDEKALNEMMLKGIPGNGGINYLEIQGATGQAYLKDMEWCQDYAMNNRQYMMDIMIDVVNEVTSASPDMSSAVNIHHNYCSCERCSYTDPRTGEKVDRDLYVTRKGATSARSGQLGIIPGSMGVGSFIVSGKGNPEAWSSCSHGAGRKMSRNKAVATISQSEFEQAMEGIVCDTDPRVRDEAPQAYKDLTQVMKNQESLVDIVHRLKTLVNVKGFGKGPIGRKR